MKDIEELTTEYSDEALCAKAREGDLTAEEELVLRYQRQVRICARPFFLAGGDSEDLIQEAMFGLIKASVNLTPVVTLPFAPLPTSAFAIAFVPPLPLHPGGNTHL